MPKISYKNLYLIGKITLKYYIYELYILSKFRLLTANFQKKLIFTRN